MRKLFFLLLAVCAFAGCDNSDDGDKNIIVPKGSQLNQNVYADDISGVSAVNFTTTGAWTSSIVESTSTRAGIAAATDWISIDPASGSAAGNYSLNITLDTNLTGANRAATIVIECNGQKISIKITQNGKTEDGEVPEEGNSSTGTGMLTYSLADGNPFKITRAEQRINVGSAITRVRLKFNNEEGQYIDLPLSLFMNKNNNTLQAGKYTGISYDASSEVAGRFYLHQKGVFLGNYYYYNDSNGGTITVSMDGQGVYTVNFDINTTVDGDGFGTAGKIRGSYIGKITLITE